MLFTSFAFIFFFLVTTSIYFWIPSRFQTLFLFIIGIIFYMSFIPSYIVFLFALIIIDYSTGIGLTHPAWKKYRLPLLCVSVAANLGMLGVFKYYNFFLDTAQTLTSLAGITLPTIPHLSMLLPIGLSFHTFQSLSYVIEVYKKSIRPEKNPLIYATYVLFYPQLVAGPIEQPQSLIPQLHETHAFSSERFIRGGKRMMIGLWKKMVIADRIALLIDPVFSSLQTQNGTTIAVSLLLFSFQIYTDFSGYCDIALGAADILGLTLMENFRFPLLATSVNDFWKRWHISLTTWFRTYVYIPLGGNRYGALTTMRNTIIVFLLSGLWHGANYTFIIWGGLHGIGVIISRFFDTHISQTILTHPIVKVLLTIMTFTTVSIFWIFFRVPNVSAALHALSQISSAGVLTFHGEEWIIACVAMSMLIIYEAIQQSDSYAKKIERLPAIAHAIFWYGVIVTMVMFGTYEQVHFIYFQF
jgi:D-alanyl-lipoteichoic acid acyltransferase DltB (MBOAT superfamily)